ncbi:MAG: extracellular solute-binding protein [Eubacteriales bacterium]|nr:extracellular solute-binding protein [Eubacteriales bacterium]
MKRKIINFIIVLAIASSALVGCGKGGVNEEELKANIEAKMEDPAWKEAMTTPYGAYPETVIYTLGKTAQNYDALKDSEYKGDNDVNNAWTRYIKKKLNIQNENLFEANDGEDYAQKVSMAMVSNEIPDIMVVPDYETLKQLYENDLIADLTESYENCASDVIKDIYNSYEGRVLENATFDGKLMALPTTEISHGPGILWLRQDWMDKLGLQPPKTLEDVEHILQEFKDKNPGNNSDGTTGLVIAPEVVGKSGGHYQINNIFAYFGAYPYQWLDDGTGKAIYGSIQPEMKEALTVLADWYKKGLIDKQMAVRNYDDRKAILTSGKSGAFFHNWWGGWEVNEATTLNPEAKWTPYIAPFDENGELKMFTGNPNSSYLVVRKGFEHPEILIKLANIQYDLSEYDENKEDLKELNDYKKMNVGGSILETNIDYFDGLIVRGLRIKEAVDKGDTSNLSRTDISLYEDCKNYVDKLKNGEEITPVEWANYMSLIEAPNAVAQANIKEINPIFFGNTSSMSLKWPTLSKLEQEMYLKIITGEKPVDYFDEFVETWKKTGGDEITEEVNQAIAEKK